MYKINSKDSELVNTGTEMRLGRWKKNSGEHLALFFSAQLYFSSSNWSRHGSLYILEHSLPSDDNHRVKMWIKCWKTQIVALKRVRKTCLKTLHMAWCVEIKLTIKQANSKKIQTRKIPPKQLEGRRWPYLYGKLWRKSSNVHVQVFFCHFWLLIGVEFFLIFYLWF